MPGNRSVVFESQTTEGGKPALSRADQLNKKLQTVGVFHSGLLRKHGQRALFATWEDRYFELQKGKLCWREPGKPKAPFLREVPTETVLSVLTHKTSPEVPANEIHIVHTVGSTDKTETRKLASVREGEAAVKDINEWVDALKREKDAREVPARPQTTSFPAPVTAPSNEAVAAAGPASAPVSPGLQNKEAPEDPPTCACSEEDKSAGKCNGASTVYVGKAQIEAFLEQGIAGKMDQAQVNSVEESMRTWSTAGIYYWVDQWQARAGKHVLDSVAVLAFSRLDCQTRNQHLMTKLREACPPPPPPRPTQNGGIVVAARGGPLPEADSKAPVADPEVRNHSPRKSAEPSASVSEVSPSQPTQMTCKCTDKQAASCNCSVGGGVGEEHLEALLQKVLSGSLDVRLHRTMADEMRRWSIGDVSYWLDQWQARAGKHQLDDNMMSMLAQMDCNTRNEYIVSIVAEASQPVPEMTQDAIKGRWKDVQEQAQAIFQCLDGDSDGWVYTQELLEQSILQLADFDQSMLDVALEYRSPHPTATEIKKAASRTVKDKKQSNKGNVDLDSVHQGNLSVLLRALDTEPDYKNDPASTLKHWLTFIYQFFADERSKAAVISWLFKLQQQSCLTLMESMRVMELYDDMALLQSEHRGATVEIKPQFHECLMRPAGDGQRTVMEAVDSGEFGQEQWLEFHRLVKVCHGKKELDLLLGETQASAQLSTVEDAQIRHIFNGLCTRWSVAGLSTERRLPVKLLHELDPELFAQEYNVSEVHLPAFISFFRNFKKTKGSTLFHTKLDMWDSTLVGDTRLQLIPKASSPCRSCQACVIS